MSGATMGALVAASAAAAGTWSTAYTDTLPSNGGGETGAYRIVVPAISKTISKIRISVKAPSGTTTVLHFAVGIQSSADTTTATPTEIRFAGASGWTGSAGATATSDDTFFSAASGSVLLINVDISGTTAPAYNGSGTNSMYRITSGAFYNSTTMGGTLNGGSIRAAVISSVEIFG